VFPEQAEQMTRRRLGFVTQGNLQNPQLQDELYDLQ
jgi:hypothetical protein